MPPQRFTPTGVGKIAAVPRLRKIPFRFTPTGVGKISAPLDCSPPHLRFTPTGVGKIRMAFRHSRLAIRFTPTGVGKMIFTSKQMVQVTVHPHGCGEDALILVRVLGGVAGSPPRVWGRLAGDDGVGRRSRFTPTGVGKIQKKGGELSTLSGSPPRVWGR